MGRHYPRTGRRRPQDDRSGSAAVRVGVAVLPQHGRPDDRRRGQTVEPADRDREVDPQWTVQLRNGPQGASKEVELFWYPGQDHNWSGGWGEIAPRTVAFFDRTVKSAPAGAQDA